MMFGSNNNVFHPGILCHSYPFIRIIKNRIKLFCKLLVFCNRNFTTVHNPFPNSVDTLSFICTGWHSIYAPVNKHAKAGITPPLHTAVVSSILSHKLHGLRKTYLKQNHTSNKSKKEFFHIATFKPFNDSATKE